MSAIGHQAVAHGAQLLGAFEAELAARLHVDLDRARGRVLNLIRELLGVDRMELPSGHTVASGSFNAACACTIAGAPSNAPIPTPAFKASLRPSFIEDPICPLIPRTPLLGRRYSAARGGL
jgi:hypothetical protein